jgi:serralysin
MATPTQNHVSVTTLNIQGLSNDLGALIDGAKWGGGWGTGVTLTYSFPAEGGGYHPSHGYGTNFEYDHWYALTSAQRAAVVQALGIASRSANIDFVPVADDQYTVGEMRFAGTWNVSPGSYAHAYTPQSGVVESGDVWFSEEWYDDPIGRGTHGFTTILHEIGHALGLKHPFDPTEGNGRVLPSGREHYTYTVMSYSAGPNADGAYFYPTTFMYLDLVALETLYGAPTDANLGNTHYVYRSDTTYWETIVDSGGKDTFTYSSAFDGGYIDLSNKTFTQVGQPVRLHDNSYNYDTIAFGPSTIIENANGGEGNDTIIGNLKANKLNGNGGNDVLSGGGGNDQLNGGLGADRVNGGSGKDKIVWSIDDKVNGGGGVDTLKVNGDSLDLTLLSRKVLEIEQIDLRGGGAGRLTLNRADVLELSKSTNNIRILGDAVDAVDIASSFKAGASSNGFRTYKLGIGALLTIETDVTVV